jgi:hypothetical protein
MMTRNVSDRSRRTCVSAHPIVATRISYAAKSAGWTMEANNVAQWYTLNKQVLFFIHI